MGFKVIAKSPCAILMENGVRGINAYCDYLRRVRGDREGGAGAIVMNANPFTLGHLHLIRQASQAVPWLYIIVVREDHEMFNYAERKAMIEAAIDDNRGDLPNVTVVEGSDYAVSEVTFPTYFLKAVTDATDTHITLDLDLFVTHIAPALGVTTRFVGTEPTDRLTARYNELMAEQLPQRGIRVQAVERFAIAGEPVSASRVREAFDEENFLQAASLVPRTTQPHLIAHLAVQALQIELDTTPKPGLVDQHDNGAHHDMDYALMCKSIQALRPYFVQLAWLGFECGRQGIDVDVAQMRTIGITAERAMLQATGGVNTHRGALFSLGLIATAAAWLAVNDGGIDKDRLQQQIISLAQQMPKAHGTHGGEAVEKYHVMGALDMAREGYWALFNLWIGNYAPCRSARILLLLLIMSELDDTNVLHRSHDMQVLRDVQRKAADICHYWHTHDYVDELGCTHGSVPTSPEAHCEPFNTTLVEALNQEFIERNISPGGSADMLALTILVCSLLNYN